VPEAIVIGLQSDIGREIANRLLRDRWLVRGTTRLSCDLASRASVEDACHRLQGPWDLFLVAAGTYEPLGPFFSTDIEDWEMCLQVNALAPLRLLRRLWASRTAGAQVCFFAGPNPNRANPTYSAYTAAKVILHKLVEDLQAEYPENKFFILGPGLTRTKMLNETIKAGVRAAYYDRVRAFLESGEQGTTFDDIYAMLRACMAGDAGGRNVHVKDDWRLLNLSKHDYKLRRHEVK
jgi:NAD(P)-dependent dehydrogenase (short-subunit alcohol dehydrogenase family)